ncbi:S-locus-specific glycoprotein BS29-2-like [Chenopodium quinoa]|uniref:S-locus-specific glycoprotein BS29-2-like n=1 Tax=Chenopodium quinoa TaxID=63459 RepID=UPI000B782E5E|nr:S-locus-specific glycoprotein BS29-2-like [Chenopodium quinoa]
MGRSIWQSFQYPADSVLPNMKFILNNNPEFRKVVQAWKSPSDPSVGRYSVGANETLLPRYVIIDQGILAESGGMIARRTGELRGMPRKNICDTYVCVENLETATRRLNLCAAA